MSFKELCTNLEEKIKNSYEQGVTGTEAEKLAGEFLVAQLIVSEELKNADLNSRMRKSGLKAVRAAFYLDIVQKSDKRPTEAQTAAMVDVNPVVQEEQNSFDKAEVDRDNLERYYNVFAAAHIHFRTVAKGSFNS
jgi:hypothetical protein